MSIAFMFSRRYWILLVLLLFLVASLKTSSSISAPWSSSSAGSPGSRGRA